MKTKTPILSLKNLRCRAGKKTILSIENLSLNSGNFNAIVGANGAGKTTLLKAISGDTSYSGHIFLHDQNINSWPSLERAKHLGVLPQSSQLSFPFKAYEVVALGLTPLALNQRDGNQQIRYQMLRTDSLHLAEKPYTQLSGGEKQRVQLARVLLQLSQAQQPPLLLLDEPTSAQDLGQQHGLLSLARELCKEQGFGVLAILHDLNQVLRYCDHCYVLNQGELHTQGRPEACLTQNTIELNWGYRPTITPKQEHPNCVIS